MKITIERKSVYGNKLYYPVCSKAKAFAKLIGSVTLTDQKLRDIKHGLGYEIELKQETVTF